MTTTAGVPGPGLATTAGAVDAKALLPASAALPRVPWVLLCADVLGAAVTAVIGGIVLPVWTPIELLVLALVWPALVAACGGYSTTLGVPHALRPRTLVRSSAVLALIAWPLAAVMPGLLAGSARETARSLALVVTLLPLFSLLVRCSIRPLAIAPMRRVVMVGEIGDLRRMLFEADLARTVGRSDFVPVALCLQGDDLTHAVELEGTTGVAVTHGTAELTRLVDSLEANAVVVVPGGGIDHAELRRWGAWMQDRGVELLVSSGLRDVAPFRLGRSAIGGFHLLQVRPAAIRGLSHAVKNGLDRLVGGGLLLLFAPLLMTLALLVRRDSAGPALYTQTRVGRDGRPFTVYKLRTMRQDADQVLVELGDANESDSTGVLFKMRADPRITKLGAVLRRYSLDELPQLWNVVRGDMSLIGPRPALPSEVAGYPADLCRRLVVKPGLTGLWQVSGRSNLSWEQTVRLDLEYVDNWSWGLDARIAVKTLRAVIGHDGAY